MCKNNRRPILPFLDDQMGLTESVSSTGEFDLRKIKEDPLEYESLYSDRIDTERRYYDQQGRMKDMNNDATPNFATRNFSNFSDGSKSNNEKISSAMRTKFTDQEQTPKHKPTPRIELRKDREQVLDIEAKSKKFPKKDIIHQYIGFSKRKQWIPLKHNLAKLNDKSEKLKNMGKNQKVNFMKKRDPQIIEQKLQQKDQVESKTFERANLASIMKKYLKKPEKKGKNNISKLIKIFNKKIDQKNYMKRSVSPRNSTIKQYSLSNRTKKLLKRSSHTDSKNSGSDIFSRNSEKPNVRPRLSNPCQKQTYNPSSNWLSKLLSLNYNSNRRIEGIERTEIDSKKSYCWQETYQKQLPTVSIC